MGAPTTRGMTLASKLPFKLNPIIDITDSLPKNSRGGWLEMPTMRKDGNPATGPRDYRDITHISLHHTAVEGGTPEGHARFHIGKKSKSTPDGYGGIAYHIYVKGGQIYQVNDLLALTWHTQSHNYHTIGICVEGDFTQRELTDTERQALYGAIVTVMQLFNIPVENVKGHDEYWPTACPGYSMVRIREDLRVLIDTMSRSDSWDVQLTKASQVINEINYWRKEIGDRGKDDPYAQRCMDNFMMLWEEMDKRGKIPH